MTERAWPHGFRDGLGGALALLADRFSDDELSRLRGRFAVAEHFEPVLGADGDVEGWIPTRWPLACDAALATLAARALAPSDPAVQTVLQRLRADCDDDELRRWAGAIHTSWPRHALEAEIALIASLPSSDASRALAQSHRLLPLTSYDVHRSLASSSAASAAALLRLALETGVLTLEKVIDTVCGWAPEGGHGARTSAPHLTPSTWPGFAVLVDGAVDATLPTRLAEAFASATGVDEASERFETLTEGLEGAGLVAVVGDEGVVLRRGTVQAWTTDGSSVSHIAAPCSRNKAASSTWVLSAGTIDEAALPLVATGPVDRALGRLLPFRTPGLAELFSVTSPHAESAPPRPGAVALVRAPASPAPSLLPDPVELASRRAALEALVDEALRGTHGLFAEVAVAGHDGTNGALEQIAVLRVLIVRDDVEGASSELDAVAAIEDAIAARPGLAPCEVVGDYVK